MFDELNKYRESGHFFFKPDDKLSAVCNAPRACSGIYLIYALEHGKVNLVYIGISGKEGPDGKIKHRKDGLRGRFLTGKTEGVLRKNYWPKKMIQENIEALDIYWYVTHGELDHDFPRGLEVTLLKNYFAINGKLPRWNRRV